MKRNADKAMSAGLVGLSATAQVLGGTMMAASSELNRSENISSQIIDYSKCPYCHSTDIRDLTEEKWEKVKNEKTEGNNKGSEADEILKFKKLLDEGIITQQEFEAKKKKILGL